MTESSARYGESPQVRKQNAKKLKEIRLEHGWSASQAAEKLGLPNVSAVVNAEVACSTDKFLKRAEEYRQLTTRHGQARSSKAHDRGDTGHSPPIDKKINLVASNSNAQADSANDSQRREQYKVSLLNLAVKKLALANGVSEAEVWLALFDESQKND